MGMREWENWPKPAGGAGHGRPSQARRSVVVGFAESLSPGGAAVVSQGRKPLEVGEQKRVSPGGATVHRRPFYEERRSVNCRLCLFRLFFLRSGFCLRSARLRRPAAPPRPAPSRHRPTIRSWAPPRRGSSFYSGSRPRWEVGPMMVWDACRPILRESGRGPNGACAARHARSPRRSGTCHSPPPVYPAAAAGANATPSLSTL